MNAQIIPFRYREASDLRTVIIDGDPWFVLADLCRVLDIANVGNVTARLSDDMTGSIRLADGTPGNPNKIIVSEAGMYEVVIRSDKPEAASFRRWITSEVLPAIRKHGGYLTPEAIERTLTDPDFIIRLATDLKTERARRVELEDAARILTPKAEAFDAFLSTHGDLSMNEAAKEVARGSGVITGEDRLRKAMIRWGWIYRDAAHKPRAYQAQIDLKRLAEKPQWHYHPQTGEKVLDTPQVRVTAKGVAAAAERLARESAEVAS